MRVIQTSSRIELRYLIQLSILIGGFVTSQTSEAAWNTGQAFQRQLQSTSAVSWTNVPLRRAINSLSERHQVLIWIDRRIDPNQPITMTVRASLRSVLQQIGSDAGFYVGTIDSVVYLGPRPTAAKIATLSEQLTNQARSLPAANRRKWLQRSGWSWPELSEPRKLMMQQADRYRFKIAAIDTIPHDLFRAQTLPPLRTIDKLQLIAAGFGKSIAFDKNGGGCRLTEIPDRIAIRKVFTVPPSRISTLDTLTDRLSKESKSSLQGDRLTVEGYVEDLTATRQWLAGEQPKPQRSLPAPINQKRFTLRGENQSTINLIKALTTNLGYELKYPPELEDELSRLTSIDVKDAPFDDVIDELVRPLQLRFKVSANALVLERDK